MSQTVRALTLAVAMLLTAIVLWLVIPTVPVLELTTPGNASVTSPALKVSLAGGTTAPALEEAPPQPNAKPEPEPEPEPEPQPEPEPDPVPEPEPKPEPVPEPEPDPVPEPEPEPEPQPEPEPEPIPPPTPRDPEPVEPNPPQTEVSNATTRPAVEAKTTVATQEPDAGADEATQQAQVELVAGNDQAVDQYLGELSRHLSRYRDYPRRARRLRQEGTPVVIFEFDRSGRLLEARLQESSSHRLLDEAALELLRNASPLPEVPESMLGRSFTYTLPVGYKLR